MFLLFSSDHTIRYKRNVLEMLCYPEGHVFSLRYGHEYVSPLLKELRTKGEMLLEWKQKFGKVGITVYAERPEHPEKEPFRFCPVREVEVVRIRVLGSVYYVDVCLGKFIKFSSQANGHDYLERWQKELKSLEHGPKPVEAKEKESYFFLWHQKPSVHYTTEQKTPLEAWESTVELLSQFRSMEPAVFYHVLGFYETSGLAGVTVHSDLRRNSPLRMTVG